MAQDYDFKVGKDHYRGHGWLGLVALAIVQPSRPTLGGAGMFTVSSTLWWLVQIVRDYFDS